MVRAMKDAGAVSVAHSHDREEVVWVLAGEAVARLGDEEHRLGPGDTLIVPPGVVHQVSNPGPKASECILAKPAGIRFLTPEGEPMETPSSGRGWSNATTGRPSGASHGSARALGGRGLKDHEARGHDPRDEPGSFVSRRRLRAGARRDVRLGGEDRGVEDLINPAQEDHREGDASDAQEDATSACG